jgi:ribonuclease T2
VPRSPRAMMQTLVAIFLMVGFALVQWPSGEPAARKVEREAARAEASPGDFDFYVLALSWSPTHCASEAGQGRDDDLQCRSGRAYGFVVHGLWPQFMQGWPTYCATDAPRRVDVTVMEAAMAVSPSQKLVQHQWEKHGTCSGLGQGAYFRAAARAAGSVRMPERFVRPDRPVVTSADAVREEFLRTNPFLEASAVVVTCRRKDIGEVRVCLDKELRPRACSPQLRRSHCGSREARMLGVKELR